MKLQNGGALPIPAGSLSRVCSVSQGQGKRADPFCGSRVVHCSLLLLASVDRGRVQCNSCLFLLLNYIILMSVVI